MSTAPFGLTGGIGSGKSTVGQRFARRGVAVVDADVVAREVVEPGTDGLAAVVAAFGDGVLAPDGALDRKALAARVFGDEPARRRLNAILHPRIGMATAAHFARLTSGGARVLCYEASLLVENGLADAFRPLVVVVASEAVQLARTAARDAASLDDVRKRIASQLPVEQKRAVADLVIENDGDLAALFVAADRALDAILRRYGFDPADYPVRD